MPEWKPGDKWSLHHLYRRFLAGLGDAVVTKLPDEAPAKPLDLVCRQPLPRHVRLYVFNCTDHPAERKAGDYRIQLRLPGQRPRERGTLDMSPGCLVLLAGYVAAFDVFVMWDAVAHQDFPYSKGVQVAAQTVHDAAIYGCSEQRRDVRRGGSYPEWVVAVQTDQLVTGILRRKELTRRSLLDGLASSKVEDRK
ncbi:hypothetical protein [Amycolatopsis arida]|uniref:hypothetical protein n=1 Tax=Amycolatopsis arida TaxID=587909 RepID=UPI003C7DB8F4